MNPTYAEQRLAGEQMGQCQRQIGRQICVTFGARKIIGNLTMEAKRKWFYNVFNYLLYEKKP